MLLGACGFARVERVGTLLHQALELIAQLQGLVSSHAVLPFLEAKEAWLLLAWARLGILGRASARYDLKTESDRRLAKRIAQTAGWNREEWCWAHWPNSFPLRVSERQQREVKEAKELRSPSSAVGPRSFPFSAV